MRGTEEEEIERRQLQTIKIKENGEIKGEERRLTRTKKRKKVGKRIKESCTANSIERGRLRIKTN